MAGLACRKPITPLGFASLRASVGRALALVALVGCAKTTTFSGSLDTPAPIAVLDPAVSPFDTPVGYVADLNGGRIRLLDLVRGRYLADTPVASFLRGASIGTGDERLLGGLAAYAPDDDHALVYATDRRFQQLLRIVHVEGRDANGAPVRPVPHLVGEPVFDDVDGSGDTASIEAIELQPDLATSETWTFTFDGVNWDPVGTRSGPQPPAFPGVAWNARNGALTLIVRGTPSPGDTLTFTVDRAIEEIDLGGTPLDVAVSPDRAWLAVTHAVPEGGAVVRLADPDDGHPGAPLPLDAGAEPGELTWTDDGSTLLAADTALPVLWEIDPSTSAVIRHDLPWPVAHVAVLTTEARRRAFVAPVGRGEVWLLDLDADALIDVDPATAEVDGMPLLSDVQGLAAIDTPYDLPADTDDDPDVRSVAVSLFDGTVVWIREGDGCLVPDALGPRTQTLSSASSFPDYQPNYPIQVPGTAYLEALPDGKHHVTVNPCAGLAPAEGWQLRYDENLQGWRAQGSVSGEQERLVLEDERWLSDRGQISLLMRAGSTPSQDGWQLAFNVLDGALRAIGDKEGDGNRDYNLDLPGRPAIFVRGADGVPFVVVASTTGDFVVRIDPRTSLVDQVWD